MVCQQYRRRPQNEAVEAGGGKDEIGEDYVCAVAVTASFVVFRGFLSIEADKGDNYHCRPWPLKTHWRLQQPMSVLVVTAVG